MPSALLLAIGLHLMVFQAASAPTQSFTLKPDATYGTIGTVNLNDVSFNPCEDQTIVLSSGIPPALAAVNKPISITITYVYQAKSSTELIASAGISMMGNLMLGNDNATAPSAIMFVPTAEQKSLTIAWDHSGPFGSIFLKTLHAKDGVERCDLADLAAPGVTGFARVTINVLITVGPTSTTGNQGAGQVSVYANGKNQDAFKDFPWGTSPFTYEPTQINWIPCGFTGLTFYNIAKKYWVKSVTEVHIKLMSQKAMTLAVSLHNVGVDKDIFKTLVQVPLTTTFGEIVIPVIGLDPSLKFDQILVADVEGAVCGPTTLPRIFVQEVTIVGTADLPTSFAASVNGKETPPNAVQGPGKGNSKTNDSVIKFSSDLVFIVLMVGIAILSGLAV